MPFLENNNYRNLTTSSDRDARHSESSHSQSSQRLRRTESSISSESAVSQKSSGSGSGHGNGHVSVGKETVAPPHVERRPKQPTPPKKEPKKKMMTEREIIDAAAGLRALKVGNNGTEIEDWIASAFVADDLAESVGSALCQHAIEGGGGRVVAKLCGALRDAPSAYALYKVKGISVNCSIFARMI
ncbi:unnamed protein product [Strongylus vulgaris]|uniref:Uncharacterized protein n=1 Tax=Strongylus vulgaris TaxID=40348 RepID=A0A3P7J551_STRVU|nr:unnamed protein product [Strongylus vulgaris]